jgi:hypothetical protein
MRQDKIFAGIFLKCDEGAREDLKNLLKCDEGAREDIRQDIFELSNPGLCRNP